MPNLTSREIKCMENIKGFTVVHASSPQSYGHTLWAHTKTWCMCSICMYDYYNTIVLILPLFSILNLLLLVSEIHVLYVNSKTFSSS